MIRRDSPLLAMVIILPQEKDDGAQWWSEKGERGGGDCTRVREILCTTEEKSVACEREKRYVKRGEEKKERVHKRGRKRWRKKRRRRKRRKSGEKWERRWWRRVINEERIPSRARAHMHERRREGERRGSRESKGILAGSSYTCTHERKGNTERLIAGERERFRERERAMGGERKIEGERDFHNFNL